MLNRFKYFLPNIKKYFKELKIKTYEIKFKHEKIIKIPYDPIPEIKITPIIYFYDKNKFNCLIIYETYINIINKFVENDFQKRSREKSKASKYFEENKINKLFEELIKDFKLYTKRCVAFNCNYNNEFDLKLKKYLKQNKTKLLN